MATRGRGFRGWAGPDEAGWALGGAGRGLADVGGVVTRALEHGLSERGAVLQTLGVTGEGWGVVCQRGRGHAAMGAWPDRAGRGRATARWGGAGSRPAMASMAAAIAASRSAVMERNRPLDDWERKRFTYFSSLSPIARKIMLDKEKIREKYGPEWARLPPAQQDEIIDRCLVGPSAGAPRDPGASEDRARFPSLHGPTGLKMVRFGDEVGAGRPGGDPFPLGAPQSFSDGGSPEGIF